jgi:prolipoprotein diacylglyceryltransferase
MVRNNSSCLDIDWAIRQRGSMFFNAQRGYQTCAACGLVTATIVSSLLTMHLQLSLIILGALILTAGSSFLGLALLGKIITGEENFIYYQYQIVTLASSAVVLKLFDQQLLPYLDIFIIGSGIVLCCGRIGCFMAGCCHGKPHDWGVCYGEDHRKAGFTPYLAGVKLFPVQLLESLVVLLVVIVGTVLMLNSAYRPGDALTWYIMAYGASRFILEFLRGDPDRRYFTIFSEAQWTSLVLMGLATWAELSGMLPCHIWHAGVAACILLMMLVFFLMERFHAIDKYRLLHPYHIKEVAEAINISTGNNCHVVVNCTSIGIQISAGKSVMETGSIFHYTLSQKNKVMSEKNAWLLSRLILRLGNFFGTRELIKGNQPVFHLLIRS